MPWSLYLALKQLFPSGRKLTLTSVFYLLSVLGVAIGVGALVISQAIMGGYGRIWRDKILQTSGHMRVQTGGVLHDVESTLAVINGEPEVVAAAPYAEGVVMLQHRNRPAFPFVRGLDLEHGPDVLPVEEFLLPGFGKLDDLDDDSVFLSTQLAEILRAYTGATIELYTPLMMEKLKADEVLLPRELRVAGLFETGWSDFDANSMIITLRLMQELYELGDGAHGIAVRLRDDADEHAVAARLNTKLEPPLRALTWDQMFVDFLWILGFEKVMIILLTIPINLVSAFVIVCAQLLSVIRKTREIGLLCALGGRPQGLVLGYCFQGAALGLLGSVLGVCAALGFLHFRNSIAITIGGWFGQEDFISQFYQFAYLPAHVSAPLIITVIASAVLLAMMASLVPALIASNLKPADALRNE